MRRLNEKEFQMMRFILSQNKPISIHRLVMYTKMPLREAVRIIWNLENKLLVSFEDDFVSLNMTEQTKFKPRENNQMKLF